MYNIQIYTRLLPRKDIMTTNDRGGFGVTYHLGHLKPSGKRDHDIGYTCKTHYITLCTLKYKKPIVPSGLFTKPSGGKEGHLPDNPHKGASRWEGEPYRMKWFTQKLLTAQGMPLERQVVRAISRGGSLLVAPCHPPSLTVSLHLSESGKHGFPNSVFVGIST
jgi:hypothetical protein